jgi:hypothetical protein
MKFREKKKVLQPGNIILIKIMIPQHQEVLVPSADILFQNVVVVINQM